MADAQAAIAGLSRRAVLRCALPGILLAVSGLVPYLDKAYTIDDPLFLMQAKQIVQTPLHPLHFEICWTDDMRCGPVYASWTALMGFLLAPAVLVGGAEWLAHTVQLTLAVISVIAMVSLVRRLGYGDTEALLGGLILVAIPPFLPLANTVFPDILALCLGLLGIERLVAWKRERRWHQAIAAGITLGLAPYARPHLILLLIIAVFLLVSDSQAFGWRRQTPTFPILWSPIAIGGLIAMLKAFLSQEGALGLAPPKLFMSIYSVPRNLTAYLVYLVFPVPFAIPWILRNWQRAVLLLVVAPSSVFVVSLLRYLRNYTDPLNASELLHFMAPFAASAIAHMLWKAWKERSPRRFFLAAWLLIPMACVVYTHLPVKYLLPVVPAVVLLLAEESRQLRRHIVIAGGTTLAVVGFAYSAAILRADNRFAAIGRRAVVELVAPHIAAGERVWIGSQWGSYWYGQRVGAIAVGSNNQQPRKGELLLVGIAAGGDKILKRFPNRTLVGSVSESCACGRTVGAGGGLYSNTLSYTLWSWGSGEVDRFELWRLN